MLSKRGDRSSGGNAVARQGTRLAFLPNASFLQRSRHFGRHVVLVVLGQHVGGGENAVFAEGASHDNTLPLAKQVGQVARCM